MDFLDLTKKRFSVRKFDGRRVEREKIEKIVAAGLNAPTAHNYQPVRIIVLDEEEPLSRFRKCTECHYNAPLAFIVSYDKNVCWKRSYDGKTSGDVDASIVATHMMLEATDLGIGSTWLMYFVPEAIRTEFHFPEERVPVALLVMGYPAPDAAPAPAHTDKVDPSRIVSYNV